MKAAEKSYEKVVYYVKDQILSGAYKIGDKLPPEREFAQLLGVSRNSVREALRILDHLGVLACYHGSGNYIVDDFANTLIEIMSLMFALQKINYREITEFRYALELQALNLAIDRASAKQIADLECYMDMLEKCSSEEIKVIYDKKIHYTITEASGNPFLLNNLTALTKIMDIYIKDMRSNILNDTDNGETLQKSHRTLVEAIREKDKAKGKAALELHFHCIYSYLDKQST